MPHRASREPPRSQRTASPGRHAAPLALLSLVAASGLLAITGCGESGSEARARAVSDLLVPEPPVELLDPLELVTTEVLAEFSPKEGGAEAGWSVRGGRFGAAGLCAAGVEPLELEAPVPAALLGATVLELSAEAAERRAVQLEWRRRDGSEAARLRQFRGDAFGAQRDRFRFFLDEIATRAAGDRVVVRLLGTPSSRPCVSGLRWLRERPVAERVAASAGRAWRIDLDHEVRDARLALPGRPLEITLPEAAEGARLRIGFALLRRPERPAVFEIAPVAGDGPRWRRELEPAESGRWQEAEIELSDPARTAGLRLRLAAEIEPGDAARGVIAVWGGARVVPPARSDSRPDILLVSIDTLRADRMSLYGAVRRTTPRLDAWAGRRAAVFEQAVAPAPWTLPSHASMFTGRESFRHGAIYREPLSPVVPTLAEMLRASGYETVAITGAGYLDPRYGLHRGFERFRYWPGATAGPHEIAHGTERALAELAAPRSRPLLLFFHTYEVHPPLRPREPWFSRWSRHAPTRWLTPERDPDADAGAREPAFSFLQYPPRRPFLAEPLPAADADLAYDLYDSGVANADEHVGRLLAALEQSGRERSTIVIVTSDHGEALGEHGLAGHGFLYEDNVRIPLAIAMPDGSGAGRRIDAQASLVDLAPTLLEAAGLEPAGEFDGRTLLPLLTGGDAAALESASRETALSYSGSLGLSVRRNAREKFLYWDGLAVDRAARDRFFDLAADPGEEHDLLARRDDRAELERDALRSLARAPGLRLSVHPAARGAARLRLAAPWLAGDRIKWMSRPQDGIRLEPGPELVVEPPEREEIVLLLRPLATASLALVAVEEGATARGTEIRLDLDALHRGDRVAVVPDRDGLAVVSGRGETTPRGALISFWWQGAAIAPGVDPADQDRELREQLGALGYLD